MNKNRNRLRKKRWMLSDYEYAELNPPLEEVKVIKGKCWYRMLDDPDWLPVGHIPCPQTLLGWFFYHLIHGIWMRYPLWSVILYCLDKGNYSGRTGK